MFSLVEHELLTLPEHLSSPGFLVVFVLLDRFMCMFCRSLFVLFLLTFVLSVLLRFTDSNYPFGIFKLFIFREIFNAEHKKGLKISKGFNQKS
jgi:hypothetical protein